MNLENPIYENLFVFIFAKNCIGFAWIHFQNFSYYHFPSILPNAIVFAILSSCVVQAREFPYPFCRAFLVDFLAPMLVLDNNNIYNNNITNLYTGCTFQHKIAVINMCPVQE